MIKLSIIILNYNTKELTLKCLQSILRHYKKQLKTKEFEIILVDNASTDTSISAISNLQSQISNLKLVKNKQNLGFAKGNNSGAKQAKGKYILFLNSDTEIQDDGFLRMIDFLEENREIGVLGGGLKNPDGSPQKSVGKFYCLFNVFLMLFLGERVGLLRECPSDYKKVDWVSGACLMTRKDLFKKLNGFDEHFFMYVEDMEFCYRAKKNGLKTFFFPDINIVHRETGSSNRSFAIVNIYKGLLYFYEKHKPGWQFTLVKIFLIIKAWLAISIGSLTGNLFLVSTYKKALKTSL